MVDKPKIAMIGDGNVGTALTQGLTRAGYEVQAVGKEPERVRELAKWGEVIVLAVPFAERQNAIREIGEAGRGKVIVDVTNAMGDKMSFAGSAQQSGAEEIQEWARDAKVVKAFNTVFAQLMSEGKVHGEKLTMLAAGNDEGAKRRVLEMGGALGFDAVDAGPLENARWLETLGYFNIKMGYAQGFGPASGWKYVHTATAESEGRTAEGGARKAEEHTGARR